ncbi:MAG: C1 family peptidase [Duncaniella sp.]|nr:C1 family peptidase [Duncaniella sp.]
MTSSVTVWTSAATSALESRFTERMRLFSGWNEVYDSFQLAGRDASAVAELINNAFNRLVNMTMSDSTLHIVAVVPLFETDSSVQIRMLYDVCAAVKHSITLHIIGLCGGLSHLFAGNSADAEDAVGEARETLKALSRESVVNLSYTLLDDYAANGAPIRFDIGSLAQYLSVLQLALTENYYAILSPGMVAAHQGENLSVGVSSLTFDKTGTISRLLGMGFMKALENVGINDKEIDAQLAAHKAEEFLAGIAQRYPELYRKKIHPLYKDDYTIEGEVVAKAASILEQDVESLKNSILALLQDENFTLPEKEAILALILGRDNENLRGMQYEHEGLLLDDACDETINLYVDAFNRCCSGSDCLPVRGDFELLKKYLWNDSEEDFVENPENSKAFNPLPFIKQLKQEIINNTSFIRERTDELNGIQESVARREEFENIRRKWCRPEGDLKKVQYKEQPLDDKYSPAKGLKIKEAVDLRKFFPPVRNQEHLGACTSFAAAAMYDAMMNRNGVDGNNEMSPAFLYYYSNIVTGRMDGGSNFFEQLEVMGSRGVCHDNLYRYNADSPALPPSQAAVADASANRVIAAKQITLSDTADKADSIRQNHRLMTSALSEGYPIGISLKIFDNLGKNGPFVLHPEDSHGAKEEGLHAMVVVGFSEKDNFYIVRNSWGPEFGDAGYCYIPTAYIDDPDYLDFACIITEITGGSGTVAEDVPSFIANFAATETEIRIAAIRNIIAKVRIDLNHDQKLYAEYYKYYQRLMMQLTIPSVQNFIRSEAESAQSKHWINVEARKHELEDTFVGKLKEYKRFLRKSIMYLTGASLVLCTSWYGTRNYVVGLFAIISLILTVCAWMGYKWYVRIKRRQLQEELDDLATYARRQSDELLEMQIKFHVAGMWLKRFHKLSIEIGAVYDRLVSFNSTLRAWYRSYNDDVTARRRPAAQMFREIETDDDLLRNYFTSHEKLIVSKIDLMKIFEEYQVAENTLERLHENIRSAVKAEIDSLLADFSVAEYLMGVSYAYIRPVNLANEIAALLSVGQPSYKNLAMNATSPVRILMCDVERSRVVRWHSTIAPCFPLQPVHVPSTDPTALILITIHPQE